MNEGTIFICLFIVTDLTVHWSASIAMNSFGTSSLCMPLFAQCDTQVKCNCLYNTSSLQVPVSWLREWEGPEEPAVYLRSLVGKTLALGVWESRGREGRLLQDTLDLSELFHPHTFLNALRQQTARWVRMDGCIGQVYVHIHVHI